MSARPVLSFAQQRLWFVDQLTANHAAYLTPRTFELTGPLDTGALQSALRYVAQRHEVLRCRVVVDGDEPYPVFDPPDTVALRLIDLRAEASPREQALRQVRELATQPCDLSTGPLLRATALRVADETYLFHYTVHHIAFDGLSRVVFERELTTAYDAYVTGRRPELPPLALSYAEYAQRQRDSVTSAESLAQERYWVDRLGGSPEALDLPATGTRPSRPSLAAREVPFVVPQDVTKRLSALARREYTSLFVITLAAYQYLLGAHARSTDVLVGVPFGGRPDPALEHLVGFFANTVAMRANLAEPTSFTDLVGQVRDGVLDALDHQDLPFERIVDKLGVDRDTTRNPLFQNWFALAEGDLTDTGFELAGVDCVSLTLSDTLTRFDTELHLSLADGELNGYLVYATELFDARSMDHLASHYQRLLDQVSRTPDAPLSSIGLVTSDERRDLIELGTGRPAREPVRRMVVEWFEHQVRRTPDAVAVADDSTSVTYRELAARSSELTERLRQRGVRQEGVVGVLLPRGVPMVVAWLAVIRAGAAYLPVDPDLPRERIDFLLDDAAVEVVISSAPIPGRACLSVDGDPGADAGPPSVALPGNAMYVVYTSGSTGRPKGVVVSHETVTNLVRWHLDRYPMGPDDRQAQIASSSFDAAGWEVWPALLSGATLRICPDEVVRAPDSLVRWFAVNGITGAFAPTPLAEELITYPLRRDTSLRFLLTGGDVFRPRQSDDPGIAVFDHYGPTENTVVATAGDAQSAPWQDSSIGRPIDGVRAYVVDDNLRLVPRGVVGELCLGGAGLARGYCRRPGLTAQQFVPDPFTEQPGARMYRTGDLVRWRPDGTLHYAGRNDAQVKVRGYRIEPGEVESALRSHDAVREAVVSVLTARTGQRILIAYVVSNGNPPGAEELRAHLRHSLPAYLVPQRFVMVDQLPKTTSGKIDRRRLPDAGDHDGGLVGPRTDAERLVCQLWTEVLGVADVGVHDDFFAIGGNSMTSTRLLSRVRAAFAVDFALVDIFDNRTVAELATAVEARIAAQIAAMSSEEIAAALADNRAV